MATTITQRKKQSKPANRKKSGVTNGEISPSYNKFTQFEGKQYSGMKIGRIHKWYYDKGSGKRKKLHLLCGKFLTQLQNAEPEKLLKVPVFLWGQNTIGIFFPIRM